MQVNLRINWEGSWDLETAKRLGWVEYDPFGRMYRPEMFIDYESKTWSYELNSIAIDKNGAPELPSTETRVNWLTIRKEKALELQAFAWKHWKLQFITIT